MENMLPIGLITKPQGIRGEVKVKSYLDDAEGFRLIKRVFLDGEEKKVLSVRTGAGAVFLGLGGVFDRNAAELLRGKELLIPREEAPDPGEGRYYIADLLGMRVFSEEGELLGVLKEIRPSSADVYTIEKDGKEIMFPAVKGLIEKIDLGENKMVVLKKRFEEVAVL